MRIIIHIFLIIFFITFFTYLSIKTETNESLQQEKQTGLWNISVFGDIQVDIKENNNISNFEISSNHLGIWQIKVDYNISFTLEKGNKYKLTFDSYAEIAKKIIHIDCFREISIII